MRVGVLPSGETAHVGGGYTFEREVIDRLAAHAGESHHRFVFLDDPGALGRELPENVEVARGLRRGLGRVFRPARRFVIDRIVASAGVDVVWNLWPFHPVTDVPFITVVWDLQHRLQPFFPEVSSRGEWESRERHVSRRLRRAAAVIAGNEAGRREICAFYQVPDARVHLLPHPTPRFALEAADGAGTVTSARGLPEGYLLYPAQFWPHKNHANLLLALATLRDEGLRLPLVLVGSDKGNATVVRRMAADLGLSEQVRFLGFVGVDDLVALYRGALCLAYPSLFGPENLPPLEAFALGCPVVASDVPGAREQLGDAAVLVDATRPRALADGLRRVARDPALRAELVARGRDRARRWTGREFVRGVFEILDTLAPYVRCWRAEGRR